MIVMGDVYKRDAWMVEDAQERRRSKKSSVRAVGHLRSHRSHVLRIHLGADK